MTENAGTKTVKHIDAKIADAREDVAKAQAKLEILLTEKKNRERTENVSVGEEVSFEFGRGEKRRTLTGTVTAVGNDEKLGKLLAVTVGEGLDSQIIKVRAVDILFEDDSAAEAADPTGD